VGPDAGDARGEVDVAECEEIFGPVLVALPYEDLEEVAAGANATEFGLAAGVWTRDISNAHRLARLLQAGSVYINCWGTGDPAAPFGGFKASGLGREKGRANLDAYVEPRPSTRSCERPTATGTTSRGPIGGEGIVSELERYRMHIDAEWVDGADGATYVSADPFRGTPWAVVPDAGAADVDRAVAAARAALRGPWGALTGFERAELMRRLAGLIARDADRLARIETRDNGKLLREMRGQLDYLPAWLNYFSGVADKLEGRAIPSDRTNFLVYTRREPVGVVGAIVPWNSPLMLLMWKLAPALAAGCTMVVKPSESTPVSALELARLTEEAGFPAGVFNVVTGNTPELGRALVEHPGVDKVAFTGSTAVGIRVAQSAAGRLARTTLELGGKSAQLVFEDCDLDAAANGIVSGIFAAAGQTCLAGARLLVHESIHDALVERLAERARTIVLGDPLEPATEMGPLANDRQLATVTGMIDRAVAAGAHVAAGGRHRPDLGSLFVEPTVLTEVHASMEIAREEVFGPVLVVSRFRDEEEAVALANDTPYGLAAGVWTNSVHRAHRVARDLDAGTVWINAYRVVAPNVPFGGMGASGWGRENGVEAVHEYTETKAVWVELTGATRDPFRMG
jgi:acyl-CoA reductase-like NAD-dependent aldehyde dehydrogenase